MWVLSQEPCEGRVKLFAPGRGQLSPLQALPFQAWAALRQTDPPGHSPGPAQPVSPPPTVLSPPQLRLLLASSLGDPSSGLSLSSEATPTLIMVNQAPEASAPGHILLQAPGPDMGLCRPCLAVYGLSCLSTQAYMLVTSLLHLYSLWTSYPPSPRLLMASRAGSQAYALLTQHPCQFLPHLPGQ